MPRVAHEPLLSSSILVVNDDDGDDDDDITPPPPPSKKGGKVMNTFFLLLLLLAAALSGRSIVYFAFKSTNNDLSHRQLSLVWPLFPAAGSTKLKKKKTNGQRDTKS